MGKGEAPGLGFSLETDTLTRACQLNHAKHGVKPRGMLIFLKKHVEYVRDIFVVKLIASLIETSITIHILCLGLQSRDQARLLHQNW